MNLWSFTFQYWDLEYDFSVRQLLEDNIKICSGVTVGGNCISRVGL